MNRIVRLFALTAAFFTFSACGGTEPVAPADPAPATPQNVLLHGATETSLTFQWNAVEGATSYVWRLTGDTEQAREGSTDKRNVTVSDLVPGTSYRFSVCSSGPGGKSAFSPEINAETQGTAPSPSDNKICVDAPLVLKLDSAPKLGTSGAVRIFTADGKEADRIDLSDLASVNLRDDGCTVPLQQMVNDSKFNTFMDALPCGGRWRIVHYTPLRIDGKSLIIKPHADALKFNASYYVTMDAGVIEGHSGISAGEWTFTTCSAPASAASICVAPDGSGDFCTIQRALDFADKAGCTISIAPGKYEEMLFLRDKNGITLKGDSRNGVKIIYPNCESYANGSGGSATSKPAAGASIGKNGGRSVFLIENCDNLTLESLTIENSFGSTNGQAETIYFNSKNRLTIEDCSLLSYQDTFLCKGVVWVHNSLIAGHCDFIWGYPKACLFEDCEIRARAAGYIIQARVESESDKGFVFLNCSLTAEDGVKDGSMYLARSAGQPECFDNVTYVNCTMSSAIASEGWHTKVEPNPSKPTATSGWKEYGSVDAAGKAVTGHNTYGKVLTAAEAEAFSSRQAVLGY